MLSAYPLSRLMSLLIAGSVLFSCLAATDREIVATVEPTVVRVITFRVPDGWEERWRLACRRIAASARESGQDANWLIHRFEAVGGYYLVTFGRLADLRRPGTFVEGFARSEVDNILAQTFVQLHAVPYVVVSDEIWEQQAAWSTTSDMNSVTHPGVDQRTYFVRPGMESEADDLLTEMARLLQSESFPFPTEGFRSVQGDDIAVHVLTFFGDRSDYFATGQPVKYLENKEALTRWLELEDRLAAASQNPLRRASRFVYEDSYDPWLEDWCSKHCEQ